MGKGLPLSKGEAPLERVVGVHIVLHKIVKEADIASASCYIRFRCGLVVLFAARSSLRVEGQFEESRANFLRIFLCGRDGAVAVAGKKQFHLHGDFKDQREAGTDVKGARRRVKSPLGGNAGGDGRHRKGHNRCGRHVHEHVLLKDDLAGRSAFRAGGVEVDDFDGHRDRTLHAGALTVRLLVHDKVCHRSLRSEGARRDKRERICRVCGRGVHEGDGIIFEPRLDDPRVEDFFRLDAHLFAKTVQRIACDGPGAMVR